MKKTFQAMTVLLAVVVSFAFAPSAAQAETEQGFVEEPASPSSEDLSQSQTAYIGARLLKGNQNVTVGGIATGKYDDPESNKYYYWQGDTLFAGVSDADSGVKVELIAEFFWFESSIWRNADFYVVVLKAKSSPNPTADWYLKEANGWWTDMLGATDTAQLLEIHMNPTGAYGGIRWDWCVPFDSYKWEPEKTIEVESGYSAGFDAEGGFSEGGILKDLTDKSNIQAKGYVSAKHKVSTHYTVTMYRWQVLVNSGGSEMIWQTRILPGGNAEDSSYGEYFLVLQADKGATVKIDELMFGGGFKHGLWYWFDGYKGISAKLTNITFNAPEGCYMDDPIPEYVCPKVGVCGEAEGFCDANAGQFACSFPETYEKTEAMCDGLDNDCNGQIDEMFENLGQPCDGEDPDEIATGEYVCNPEGDGVVCNEDPCAAMECGMGCGECPNGLICVDGLCTEALGAKVEGCGTITEEGTCNGDILMYCNGIEVVEVVCQTCCGYNADAGYFACLPPQACEEETEACQPQCDGKSCGDDGCGGTCGACADGEICTYEGLCIDLSLPVEEEEEPTAEGCGFCAAGSVCVDGECVETGFDSGSYEQGDMGGEGAGCTAMPGAGGNPSSLILFLLVGLAFVAFRQVTVKQ